MRTLVPLALCSIILAVLSSTASAVDSVRETRTVPAFHGISVETVADLDVTIGPVTKVEVSAPKDALAKLETVVEHGSLQLRAPGFRRDSGVTFKVSITTPSLDAIAISGVSNVHVAGLHAKELALAVDGAAEFHISGSADSLALAISGAAELDLQSLATHDTALQISGVISGAVRADRSVAASISGTGTIDVYGKPKSVTRAISGMATLTER